MKWGYEPVSNYPTPLELGIKSPLNNTKTEEMKTKKRVKLIYAEDSR
jgi:hypothetical protein